MYQKNDIKISDSGFIYDTRNDYKDVPLKTLYLPHSCDEWIIGGKEEAEQTCLPAGR